ALFRALDEGLVDLDAPDPAVERDADQQHDQDPARRDLDEGLHFQTRSSTLAETIATVSAQIVAPRQGRMIPAGSLECAEARSARASLSTSPAFSAIFKSPSQSAMTPIRPMASVTPCAAPSNAPWPTAFTSPLTAPAMAAATNSSTKTMFTVSLRSPWTRNVA